MCIAKIIMLILFDRSLNADSLLEGHQQGVVITPPVDSTVTVAEESTLGGHILPYVMFWDPIHKFADTLSNQCLCESCSGTLRVKCWRTGQSLSMQPRLLHGIEHNVLLVSPIYICEYSHTLSSTDPRLTENILQEHIPFILLHRTGFTRHFVNTIVHLYREGMPILGIERFVGKMRHQMVATLIIQLVNSMPVGDSRVCASNYLEKCEEMNALRYPIPSNDVICQCILVHFMEKRSYYNYEMSQIPIDNYISVDHTFKVSSNIGYKRSDGKWVTLYNSVFIVLNEIGQVVAWQLTSSTSIDEVAFMLSELKSRIHQPVTVFVDNCCQQRSKLTQIFGEDITVSLDIFHAIQRLVKVMPKKHPMFNYCLRDLRLVFRRSSDIGNSRQKPTPDNDELISNLDNFVKKWKNIELNGWKLFNQKMYAQVNALKLHISRGCLSNIVEGGGTNRNEALHRHINPHFKTKTKIGLPLALALLTLLLYEHNNRITEKKNR